MRFHSFAKIGVEMKFECKLHKILALHSLQLQQRLVSTNSFIYLECKKDGTSLRFFSVLDFELNESEWSWAHRTLSISNAFCFRFRFAYHLSVEIRLAKCIMDTCKMCTEHYVVRYQMTFSIHSKFFMYFCFSLSLSVLLGVLHQFRLPQYFVSFDSIFLVHWTSWLQAFMYSSISICLFSVIYVYQF